jgi:hypothetical protein
MAINRLLQALATSLLWTAAAIVRQAQPREDTLGIS